MFLPWNYMYASTYKTIQNNITLLADNCNSNSQVTKRWCEAQHNSGIVSNINTKMILRFISEDISFLHVLKIYILHQPDVTMLAMGLGVCCSREGGWRPSTTSSSISSGSAMSCSGSPMLKISQYVMKVWEWVKHASAITQSTPPFQNIKDKIIFLIVSWHFHRTLTPIHWGLTIQ